MSSIPKAIVAAAADEMEWLMNLEQPRGDCCYCHRTGSPSVDVVGDWVHSGFVCSDHRGRIPKDRELAEVLVERVVQAGAKHALDRALRHKAPYIRNPTIAEIMSGAPEDAMVLAVRREGVLRLLLLELDFSLAGQDLTSAMPRPAHDQIDRGSAMSVWATAAQLGRVKKTLLADIRGGND